MIGKILGNRYEILEQIGSGGMAFVYKAKCHLLKRIVAVKILKPEFNDDEEFVKRFGIEAQSSASLSHPNIVSVYDVGKEDDIYYIVMEYIDGTTLNKYIEKKGRLEWKEAIKIAIQICLAIQHAHKNFIVHRDIKPQNIMLSKDGRVKVTDFGIARATTAATITMSGSTLGSVRYFSPEQARGGYIDEKSDLYSLGVVMYEMITGKPPFDGDAPVSIALKQIQNQAVPPAELIKKLPAGVNGIIMKAMEKDPKMRYGSAGEMLDDMYSVFEDPEMNILLATNSNNDTTRRIAAIDPAGIENREGDTIGINRKKKKSKKDMTVLFAILISLVLTGVFVYLGYEILLPPISNGSSNKIPVENYVDKNVYEVADILEGKGITVKIKWENSDDVKKDIIISQSVPAGLTFVEDGFNSIEFTASLGPDEIVVPALKNEDARDAELALKELGLRVTVEPQTSDTVPANLVIGSEPGAGVTVKSGDMIIIYKSIGEEVEMIPVPDLAGLSLEEATQIILENKLKVGELKPDEDVAAVSKIIGQIPAADTEVYEDQAIDLIFDEKNAETTYEYKVELANPGDYQGKIEVYMEASLSSGRTVSIMPVTVKDKNSFPLNVVLPIPIHGSTTLRVIMDGNLAEETTIKYDDIKQ